MTLDQIQQWAETVLTILGALSALATVLGALPLGKFAAAAKVVGVDLSAILAKLGRKPAALPEKLP